MASFNATAADKLVSSGKVEKAAAQGLSSCIYIVEAANITSIPARDTDDNKISSDIVMDSGKTFKSWDIAEDGSLFSYSGTGTKGAAGFKNVVTVFLPGERSVFEDFLNKGVNDNFVLIIPDDRGANRLVGTNHSPARAVPDSIEFFKNGDKNGCMITFEFTGEIAPVYTGSIPLT